MTELRDALTNVLAEVSQERLAESVRRLIADYRSGRPADRPLLRDAVDVTAYAAYRMPATHAAVSAALRQLGQRLRPASLLDIGGGTGAAAWAATEAFPSIAEVTVLDQVPEALALGRRLAGTTLPNATWRHWQLTETAAADRADLVTVSYVLGELDPIGQRRLVEQAVRAARELVVFVEPGTPQGYRRILDARDDLIAAGWTVAAPCPHQAACGLRGRDWCHFAARVNRSALHRRLKDAQLGYEDEKFAFVAGTKAANTTAGRVVRHPAFRKGLVTLQVCRDDTSVGPQLVSKREGERYKQARDAEWGDQWPPHT